MKFNALPPNPQPSPGIHPPPMPHRGLGSGKKKQLTSAKLMRPLLMTYQKPKKMDVSILLFYCQVFREIEWVVAPSSKQGSTGEVLGVFSINQAVWQSSGGVGATIPHAVWRPVKPIQHETSCPACWARTEAPSMRKETLGV